MESELLDLFERETKISTDESYECSVRKWKGSYQIVAEQRYNTPVGHQHSFPELSNSGWSMVRVVEGHSCDDGPTFIFERDGGIPEEMVGEVHLRDLGIATFADDVERGPYDDMYIISNSTSFSEGQVKAAIESDDVHLRGIDYNGDAMQMKIKRTDGLSE